MSYKELGLKCGLEIHQQLEGLKLFSKTPTIIRDDKPDYTIKRTLRASAGEGGIIDIAASQEQAKKKIFVYEGYYDTISLVETDSEPPQPLNQDALKTCLQFCKIVKSNVVSVVQVMRKTVVDGSNTSGFQRTALIARGGILKTKEGNVQIENIAIEEDACKIVKDTPEKKIYRLDRLGIPLIEIGTAPDIKSPKQALDTAKQIGMILRSLPGVKRGLGTIRQDVNISIKEGQRVEIKGAQDLKILPFLIELEVKRQHELIKLKKELKKIKLNKLEIIDLTDLFNKTTAKIIQKTLKNNGKILGFKLENFKGIIGRELQPNYRIGTEFSGRAKIIASVGGIFHSDEMPNYGISKTDVKAIKTKLKCKNNDAFILVADLESKSRLALNTVYNRIKELYLGVPKEVRKAQPDGTTRYLRPMPGASRMYPETDVPLVYTNMNGILVPELLDEKSVRFVKEYNLSEDLANHLVRSNYVILFEDLVKKYNLKPSFIADTLTSTLAELKNNYKVNLNKITNNHLKDLFKYLDEDKIHKDIILDVLLDMANNKFNIKKYESLSTEKLHKVIIDVIKNHPKAPFSALMGICMKKLQGKVSGQILSRELGIILKKGHK